jgi:dihydropteroate synthase
MHQCTINGLKIGDGAPVRIMGVINCSPESFFKGSYRSGKDISQRAKEMIAQGADIIDIGARSTSPYAPQISPSCEAERIVAALRELDGCGAAISVDTMRPTVLGQCLKFDIHAINDINGLADPEYANIAGDSGLPCFLMASSSAPGDSASIEGTFNALQQVISRSRTHSIGEYVLDPGIGMWNNSRTVALDWELCRKFHEFKKFNHPLLVAISRKTFIGDLLSRKLPEERLAGSLALTTLLLSKGADVVRCHDVKETRDAITVYETMEKTG